MLGKGNMSSLMQEYALLTYIMYISSWKQDVMTIATWRYCFLSKIMAVE